MDGDFVSENFKNKAGSETVDAFYLMMGKGSHCSIVADCLR